MNKYITILLLLLLTSCTSLKVANVDPETGHFPSTKKADVTLSKPFDLDSRKSLILVGDSDFEKGQITNIGYFDEVISTEDLETLIVQNDLTDKVPSVQDKIGINNAAKHLKPFMWLKYDTRGDGNDKHAQFILIDPLTLEEYFIVETHLDYVWSGVNDQNNWYPMYNAFIDYIKENSSTYK